MPTSRGVSVRLAVASRGAAVTLPGKKEGAGDEEPMVFIVEDDTSFRDALRRLFHTVDLRTEVFGSAPELLQNKLPDVPACLVLDVRLPGLSGLDVQSELAKADIQIPIIFMTGHGDIPMSVKAMKAGAVDFLTKPFRDQDMLDAVGAAIERDRRRREQARAVSELRALFEVPECSRAGDHGAGHHGADEQAGRGRDWAQRDHREDPSWQRHEKNGCENPGRSGENGRGSRHREAPSDSGNQRPIEKPFCTKRGEPTAALAWMLLADPACLTDNDGQVRRV